MQDMMTIKLDARMKEALKEVAEKQEDMIQEVTGPPKKAAYDKEGNPTKAAIGFAKKHGIRIPLMRG